MISSYVCRKCRSRLIQRIASLRNPQWQSRATFISFRNEQPSLDPAQEPLQGEPALKKSSEGEYQNSRIRKVRLDTPTDGQTVWGQKQASRAGRYSRQRHGQYAKAYDTEPSEELFEGAEQAALDHPGPAEPQGPRTNRNRNRGGRVSYALRIQDHIEQGNLNKAWTTFLENYTSKDCVALTNPSFQDVTLLNGGRIFGHLLDKVVDEFCRGSEVPTSPTLALLKYEQIGLVHPGFPDFWRNTFQRLTTETLLRISGTDPTNQRTHELLHELISVWRLFFQCKGSQNASLESVDTEWRSLPDVETLGMPSDLALQQRDFRARLQHYHPKYIGNLGLAFSAITLFNLFDEQNQYVLKLPDSLREQSMPFLRLITRLLPGAKIDFIFPFTDVHYDFLMLPKDFRDTFIDQIKSAPSHAMAIIGSQGATGSAMSEAERASNLQAFILKRIQRAISEQAHVRILESLWHQTVENYTRKDQKVAIPQLIYNSFLTGYMTLFQPERAVEVWNHMTAHGIKPDARTWTAMLDGCQKARDLDGLKTIWARMIKSGVEPDNYAWTTRIHGLMKLRQIKAGFAAMDEMARKWGAAEAAIKDPSKKGNQKKNTNNLTAIKPVNKCTKPSIEIVNGAISAITQLSLPFDRKKEFVQKILQWAGNFSIKPDARSYNILIELYISNGDYAMSLKLLRQMENEKIEPDIATYTMLIGASFKNEKLSHLSEEEQAAHIISQFSDLENSGLKLNSYIYSSTIDKLLKQHSNFSAVRALIDRMMSRNMIPGPHIYTSLVTHYFQQSPPNIPAVDSLCAQIMDKQGTPTDKILFDRVIEGYASHGEVGKMMAVLTRMSTHGKLPSWQSLTAVIRALAQAGDRERAYRIVREVQSGEGIGKGRVTGGISGQKHFFHEAYRMGIARTGPKGEVISEEEYVQSQIQGHGKQRRDEHAYEAREEKIREMTKREEVQDVDAAGGHDVSTEEALEEWKAEDNGAIGGVPL